MTHILVVEDEVRIGSFFSKGFKAAGYAVSHVRTARDGLAYLRSGGIDLVVLDLGLPDEDGMTVLARLRAQDPKLPVIIVTARSSVVDTVAGLDGGADDYLAKPVRFDELLARIRARLKKTEQVGPSSVLAVGPLTLEPQTRRVKVDDRDVDLSAREFSLLETLMRNADQVLSREQLLTRVWGYDYDPDSNIVDVYVGYLRRKLGSDVIETIRGVGFRLRTS